MAEWKPPGTSGGEDDPQKLKADGFEKEKEERHMKKAGIASRKVLSMFLALVMILTSRGWSGLTASSASADEAEVATASLRSDVAEGADVVDGEQLAGSYNLYFENSWGWEHVYVHAWVDQGSNVTEWPGWEIFYDSDVGYYWCTLPDACNRVVIHDGAGNKAGGGDLSISPSNNKVNG